MPAVLTVSLKQDSTLFLLKLLDGGGYPISACFLQLTHITNRDIKQELPENPIKITNLTVSPQLVTMDHYGHSTPLIFLQFTFLSSKCLPTFCRSHFMNMDSCPLCVCLCNCYSSIAIRMIFLSKLNLISFHFPKLDSGNSMAFN